MTLGMDGEGEERLGEADRMGEDDRVGVDDRIGEEGGDGSVVVPID